MTLTYRAHPRAHFGVEYNPRVGEVRPLLTLIPVTETARRPAVIFGVSSDRIGTPSGTSVYLTASKDLTAATKLPIAPYAGIMYGSFQKRWRAIGGLQVRVNDKFTSTTIFDGVKVHPTFTYNFNRHHSLTWLMIYGHKPGWSYSFSF
jgi:hypothetical protein